MASWRAGESAKQARCREQNETTAGSAAATSSEDGTSFRCECGDDKCSRAIRLTVREYELVREHPTHFAVARDHESEQVVEENGPFAIVEIVTGEATKLARRSDPRQRGRETCWQETQATTQPGEGGVRGPDPDLAERGNAILRGRRPESTGMGKGQA